MENNDLLKIFRQNCLRDAKHAISARGSSVDQQNALAPIRRVGSCKEGAYITMWNLFLSLFLSRKSLLVFLTVTMLWKTTKIKKRGKLANLF